MVLGRFAARRSEPLSAWPSACRGKLSDDLVAAQALRYGGRIRFEPEALAPTVIDYSWPDLLAFVHRQFAMGRRYAPLFWGAATIFSVVSSHGAVDRIGNRHPLRQRPRLDPQGRGGLRLSAKCLQQARVYDAARAARSLLPALQRPAQGRGQFDLWLAPLAGLLGCWGLISAMAGSRIRWRGIHYRVGGDGMVEIVESTLPSVQGDPTGKAKRPTPALAPHWAVASEPTIVAQWPADPNSTSASQRGSRSWARVVAD